MQGPALGQRTNDDVEYTVYYDRITVFCTWIILFLMVYFLLVYVLELTLKCFSLKCTKPEFLNNCTVIANFKYVKNLIVL